MADDNRLPTNQSQLDIATALNGIASALTPQNTVNADSIYPVETSPSTHAYNEGDHLIVSGVTYVAIDDIAIGDSLVLNTNIQAETLATRMNHIEDGIEAVGTRTIFQYNGIILNSNDTVIEGIGSATIVLDNGNARIDFNARIITADSTETFAYGINRDLFASITGKTITPVFKGIMNFYDANGALDSLANGYGGTCEVLNNMDKFWRPSRIYDTSGNIGGWGSTIFTQGMRIIGTVFGTYT